MIDREAEAQEAPEHPSPTIACWERISKYGNTLGPVACNMKSCDGFRSSVKVTPGTDWPDILGVLSEKQTEGCCRVFTLHQ